MLPEGVVTQQELVLWDVAHHAVGPVGHGDRREVKSLSAKVNLGVLLYRGHVQVVVLFEHRGPPLAGYDLGLGRLRRHPGQGAAVVGLHVVAYDVVDVLGVDDLLDVAQQRLVERSLHRVH